MAPFFFFCVFTALHLRNIERIYGVKGPDVIEGLYCNPSAAIPIITKRLKQKNDEWKQLEQQLIG
jgi:histone deacetylase complex regulatory component SIN3